MEAATQELLDVRAENPLPLLPQPIRAARDHRTHPGAVQLSDEGLADVLAARVVLLHLGGDRGLIALVRGGVGEVDRVPPLVGEDGGTPHCLLVIAKELKQGTEMKGRFQLRSRSFTFMSRSTSTRSMTSWMR